MGVLIDDKLTCVLLRLKLRNGIYVKRHVLKKDLYLLSRFAPVWALYNSFEQPYFDYCSPLWDTCGKQLKDKLQKNSNYHAGRVINGSSYDIRSVNVLDNLKWKNLETRDTCKGYLNVQNQSDPHLRASFAKLNDNNINYNLSNLEPDLPLPKPKTNFLKRSFNYGAMLWNNLSYEARTAHGCPKSKSKFASLPSAGSLWFNNLYTCVF